VNRRSKRPTMETCEARRDPPKFLCKDCGVDVLEAGDWYMCYPKVWEDELGLGWTDNLCLACLEKRLSRPLVCWVDVLPVLHTINQVQPKKLSDRLVQILLAGGFTQSKPRRAGAWRSFVAVDDTALYRGQRRREAEGC
jgi:hypothetical protein